MAYRLKKGLIQVYTGNGKGKTTAALGLALRASGAGLNVYIHQFIKGRPYSELKALNNIGNIKLEQCGRGCFIKGAPKTKDIDCAKQGLKRCREVVESGEYDVVILDEINVAIKFGLIKAIEVLTMIESKPDFVEIILTGRYCPRAILKRADLITNMKEVRHPYKKNAAARLGIEH